ncbi:ThuA domain-containing protein [Flavobacterium faecale]|uniref:ThuA domain-containing protein n=1 Tax=Flavobacterium faecale TaxID=1355330 RepID=UPI003AAF0F37
MKFTKPLLMALMLFFAFNVFAKNNILKVFVFSKTQAFRHKSIPKGIETLKTLGAQNKWEMKFSEDSNDFNESIYQYDVLIFLNTSGDLFNNEQKKTFQNYIAQGKGFVGLHAATDTEKSWPWYGNMVGAVFNEHPKIQKATLVTSPSYAPFMVNDYKTRETTDEWYNFKEPVKSYVTVLTYLDEASYTGGKMNKNHPITWFHHYDGGRIFYTGLGHREEQYDDAMFLKELQNGILWAGGKINDPAPSTKKPNKLLTDNLNDNWAVFIGCPHGTVQNLANVDPTSNGKTGEPLGLNNDPKEVFKMEKEGNETILHISGEIYGALTSKLEYENYHLKLQFKWGDKIWEPRLKLPKDNGILYHANGPYRTFWNVWMQSHEFQVQIHDMGDYYALGGVEATIPLTPVNDGKLLGYQKNAPKQEIMSGKKTPFNMAKRGFDNEKPEGEWNTLEVYCLGDKSIHVVNGKVVMALENLKRITPDKQEVAATKGLIQIQSEAAEAFYKNIEIKTIRSFPKSIRKQL